jgi:hypothetical protein
MEIYLRSDGDACECMETDNSCEGFLFSVREQLILLQFHDFLKIFICDFGL